MVVNLPTELLRSFAAIVDAGSMQRATERVFVTQSALSLQMKRLEDLVQISLFNRDGRRLSLTPAGRSMLTHTREILAANDRAVLALNGDTMLGPARIGFVQDFAETLLNGVLAQFSQVDPETPIQVQVGSSAELLDLLQSGQMDVLLCLGTPDDPAAIRTMPMTWLGGGDLCRQDVLPLAVLERPCPFRDAALTALEKAGRPHRIVLETPSLAALRAAVESGLGITCRTTHFMDKVIGARGVLPSLPRIGYVRHVRSDPHPTISRLGKLMLTAAQEL
ncbi:MAG TPA: LysR substrate-binding domain-containing protein [Rhizomicrobium sp.]|nr:LysR substrate-binding domain-containing protein [Rhizomicrobium sp.]